MEQNDIEFNEVIKDVDTPKKEVTIEDCLLPEGGLSQVIEEEIDIADSEILIRSPAKTEFFRAHPNSVTVAVIEIRSGLKKEPFAIVEKLAARLPEAVSKAMHLCISDDGTLFFWGIRQADVLGGLDAVSSRNHEIVKVAEAHWTRISWDLVRRKYRVTKAKVDMGDPQWPKDRSITELLNVAFKGKIIASEDHEILKRLDGEIL